MALKLENSKEFPNISHLIKLAESNQFRIRNPKEIIESLSDNILDFIKSSNEIQLLKGLRTSIEHSISKVMVPNSFTKSYRHDKKRKFE
ncbi:hypothetical protein A7P53_16190 [Acinetobacter defluvii]|nr:hypothetical protein [Acinetobacter defluvii]